MKWFLSAPVRRYSPVRPSSSVDSGRGIELPPPLDMIGSWQSNGYLRRKQDIDKGEILVRRERTVDDAAENDKRRAKAKLEKAIRQEKGCTAGSRSELTETRNRTPLFV